MVSPTMMASENYTIGEVTRQMNSLTSILAILETNTLCATPGLRRAGVVEQTTAAAAIAGLNPDLIKIGIMEGPTAAQSPAVEGMATAQRPVTNMQAGSNNTPSLLRGLVKSATRCTSHLVKEMVAAKPMAEQMAMMRDDLVIEASNCWNAIIGFKENIAIAKPEAKRTHRVS